MSSQAIALASQFAAIPGIDETLRAVNEPSGMAMMGIALGGIVLGRFLAMGRGNESQD